MDSEELMTIIVGGHFRDNLAAFNVKPWVSLAVAKKDSIALRSSLWIWLNWREHFENPHFENPRRVLEMIPRVLEMIRGRCYEH
jgi:hypothetical protein